MKTIGSFDYKRYLAQVERAYELAYEQLASLKQKEAKKKDIKDAVGQIDVTWLIGEKKSCGRRWRMIARRTAAIYNRQYCHPSSVVVPYLHQSTGDNLVFILHIPSWMPMPNPDEVTYFLLRALERAKKMPA